MVAANPLPDPALRTWATKRQIEFLDAIDRHGSIHAAAKELGLNRNGIYASMSGLQAKAARMGYAPGHDMRHPVPSPFVVKGVSTYYDREGEARGQWVKSAVDRDRSEEIVREFVSGLVEDARGLSPSIAPPAHADADLLCVYPMGDPHFGLKAWQDETGESFDLLIAESLTNGAIDRLVTSAPDAETAILLNLGDFFHADNQDNRTRSGHQLDVDTRWSKVMQVGLRAMVHAIKRCLEKHAKVIVRNVKGNHDTHSSFALALALDAYFSNNARVTVDLSPAPFWFHRFGKNLIGATHGDGIKMANLPGIMAHDRAVDWGLTQFRYFYIGHVHHDEVKEFPGVKCESFRTLAARDAWHAGQGYRAGRDMRLIVLHSEFGEIERHRVDVAMIDPAASETIHE